MVATATGKEQSHYKNDSTDSLGIMRGWLDNEIKKDDQIKKDQPVKTLVAIPCYNEENTVGSVVLKAKQFVDEVVVIDDGSTDETAKVAEFAGAIVVRHGGNKGYGSAIQSCFRYARDHGFDVMTILDGDGQHDANEIRTVMKSVIEENADISIGSRFHDKNNIPRYRRFGIHVLTRLSNAGSKQPHHRVVDGQSGFRAYSRNAIENLNPRDHDMGVSAEILMQGRRKNLVFSEVPVSCSYAGDTSTQKPVGHGLGVIISILKYLEVEHALLFFGVPGVLLFVSGLLLGFNVYTQYITVGYLPFGPSLITIAVLILGLLLGMTGLILHAVINAADRKR